MHFEIRCGRGPGWRGRSWCLLHHHKARNSWHGALCSDSWLASRRMAGCALPAAEDSPARPPWTGLCVPAARKGISFLCLVCPGFCSCYSCISDARTAVLSLLAYSLTEHKSLPKSFLRLIQQQNFQQKEVFLPSKERNEGKKDRWRDRPTTPKSGIRLPKRAQWGC